MMSGWDGDEGESGQSEQSSLWRVYGFGENRDREMMVLV
jgi:hypothetical protein